MCPALWGLIVLVNSIQQPDETLGRETIDSIPSKHSSMINSVLAKTLKTYQLLVQCPVQHTAPTSRLALLLPE